MREDFFSPWGKKYFQKLTFERRQKSQLDGEKIRGFVSAQRERKKR